MDPQLRRRTRCLHCHVLEIPRRSRLDPCTSSPARISRELAHSLGRGGTAMTNHFVLSAPQAVIGRQWNKSASSEQRQVLELARDALFFIFDTGQRHRFDDFREGLQTGARPRFVEVPAVPGPAEDSHLPERLSRAEGFFTKLRDEPESTPERDSIQLILDTLSFIAASNQYSAFSEYLEHIAAGGPPYAVASFDTREEAESWLQNHPSPPDSANVLIANIYHEVVHDRATGIRRLPRNRDLEYYLAEHQRVAPPPPLHPSTASRKRPNGYSHSPSLLPGHGYGPEASSTSRRIIPILATAPSTRSPWPEEWSPATRHSNDLQRKVSHRGLLGLEVG